MGLFSSSPSYILTRHFFQRSLAFIYAVAFLVTAQQLKGLIGENGLLPAALFTERVSFWQSPSLFFLNSSDAWMHFFAWAGFAAASFALSGYSERLGVWVSALTWFFLWGTYLSFVNVGQIWYSFGWETMLLEAGFFAVFLGSSRVRPPAVVIWMLRWMLFRTMFGAALIKIRGDACWRDLTCLQYYFETQPILNTFSVWFHHLPVWLLKAGALFNHLIELFVPFGFFISGSLAAVSGLLTMLFQFILILSGNLSFLNFFTIVLCIPCLDDRFWSRWAVSAHPVILSDAGPIRRGLLIGLSIVVLLLSVQPTLNLISKNQVMNTSYNPLHIVNTYGMFGSITKNRSEVIIEGTSDRYPLSTSEWKEYEFFAKPGDVMRRPPFMAPYHRRLDWLMWFAAMGPWQNHPWFLNLTAKLLANNPDVLGLIKKNPFSNGPPTWIRATLYHYRLATRQEHRDRGVWWVRERQRPYFPVVSLDDPGYRDVLRQQGWLKDAK